MFDLRKTLLLATEALSNAKISHALIGGFALAHHGVSRATVDIDFLADGEQKPQIISALTKAGFKLVLETPEVLHLEGNSGFLDVLLANRPTSKKMLNEAVKDKSLGVYVLKAEDIIGLKIQAYKNDPTRELQDKADIQSLLTNNENLDINKIKAYADLFGEWNEIQKLKK
ncbi:MAG: nucleotidyl transferase AbiEii/AbiGii toxin family protein [Oligoflexia bacterium]|nr:nucleotidyl transferase AbiEii/AbiGii toxin family protein [Oligoflexia bacterium]